MTDVRRYRFSGSVITMAALAAAICLVLLNPLASAADAKVPQLQAGAEKGDVTKELELAAAYFTGRGVAQDNKMAAYWYQKAAESGDPEAENEIGFFYQAGIGVPVDHARASHWYQLSAASGLVKAKVNLGVLYVWGIGVPKDEELAAQLFREAVAKGDGTAATYLGAMYYFGDGLQQDKATAEKWFMAGAKLRDPVAAFNLGQLLSVQADHPHDLAKAAKFLRQSASGGYVPAMSALGLLLINHPELAKSPEEARTLIETAAHLGSWRSSVVLGVLARDGKGAPADPAAAYYHFMLAALQGGETAKNLLRNDLLIVSEKLTSEQTTELASSANAWYKEHPLVFAFVYKEGENWRRFPASALGVSADGVHAGQLVPLPPA